MNLFVVGWNCDPRDRERAAVALRDTQAAFPLIDPGTLGTWGSRHGFAAWMLWSDRAAGPRRYVHATKRELVLFDGTAIDPSGRVAGHDATSLAQHWPALSERLEGRFTAVRIDEEADTLDVLNDPFGVHQAFVYRSGHTWWLSNSVRLLVRIADHASIDMTGMAHCIGMRWPGGDRTLIEGITAFPAGNRWHWSVGSEPSRLAYAPIDAFAAAPKRRFDAEAAREVAGELGQQLNVLIDTYARLQCPITAGRDSRVLTALMAAGELPADYFTVGDPDSADVSIGIALAHRLGLPHERVGGTGAEVAEAWERISQQMVQQLDGMVTLAHARNALIRPARLEHVVVQLYGAAGERGRGKLLDEAFVLRPTMEGAFGRTLAKYARGGTLLHQEARSVVREHIVRTMRDLRERGVAVVDLPDAFVAIEHSRRWVGAQARQIVDHKDVVLPFLSRPYMRAAFSTPAMERLMERVPLNMLRHLAPEALTVPFERPLPAQSLAGLLLARADGVRVRVANRIGRRWRKRRVSGGRMSDRLVTMERLRSEWRERYVDRADLSSWQILDRPRFEFLTSDRCRPAERARNYIVLYQAVTALAYEEDLKTWTE